ncbi:MAG: hypothetical protein PHR36_04720 [Patescibacteria group bacterium]|nr:hypothetical protein [Patescibacteria group bacterium]
MDDFNELEDNENSGQSQNGGKSLGKNQKIAVAVLGVLAVAVIITWMTQLKENINGPFSYNPTETTKSAATCEGPECEDLKDKDTDGDGLSDWDELNVYETSPYLEDSDSDGVFDKEEIESGADPNCPAGRDCSAVADTSVGTSAEEDNASTQINSDLNAGGDTGELSTAQEENLQKMLEGQSDASALRRMLLEAGMDEETLSQISDEDLMASYKEVLESQ